MPQIKKLSEGKYLIRVSRGTGSRRVWDNRTFFGTKEEAEQEARDMAVILGRGRLGSVRFEKCVELWLESLKRTKQPKTIDNYERMIRLYATPAIGKHRLAKITDVDIRRVCDDCLHSAATVRNLHSALSAFFSWCKFRGDVRDNPCHAVKRPQKDHRTITFLDEFEAPLFIRKCSAFANGLIFEFALETGMRPEEYLALQWSDISGRDIFLQRAVQYNTTKGGGYYYKDLKTKGSRRRVPISQNMQRKLHRQRIEQHGHRLSTKFMWTDDGLVFPNTIGKPYSLTNLTRRYFQPIVEACGFSKHLTLYSLRHTCATLLLMDGKNPKVVSERLGSSVKTILETYSHVLPHIQDEATEAMDRILRKAR